MRYKNGIILCFQFLIYLKNLQKGVEKVVLIGVCSKGEFGINIIFFFYYCVDGGCNKGRVDLDKIFYYRNVEGEEKRVQY